LSTGIKHSQTEMGHVFHLHYEPLWWYVTLLRL